MARKFRMFRFFRRTMHMPFFAAMRCTFPRRFEFT
jgi:hypothetical protein